MSTNSNPSTPDTKSAAPEIRVFISSTFRDMQDEREHLIKHIFPEIRQICRERGVQFTEIDLRWGVTQEEAEQGKVLQICMDEIKRCRPYFIGILGDRYGWTPNFEDVQKDKQLVKEYPWVEECIHNGLSVTEMEILFGVLDNPTMAGHAFFYFRDHDTTREEFRETDESLKNKLTVLKTKIRDSQFPLREDFTNPSLLGNWIRKDLLEVIDTRFPQEKAPSTLEQERRVHEAFAITRRRSYIPREEYLDRLSAHAELEEQPLVVLGESGYGKSSLLAYWVESYRRRNPDTFIIEHYVGASPSGGGHYDVIRRVMEEIKERYELEDEIPATPDALERDFSRWLAKVQGEKMILVLDALNQLSGRSADLYWLPNHFPPNIRTYISTVDNNSYETFQNHGWDKLEMTPLTLDEREKITVSYLGQYRKALSREQQTRITSDSKSENPLFLRTVLEELRIFGSFEQLDEQIEYYVSADSISELFQRVLTRMENDYGTDVVREIMTLLYLSRNGLTESELLSITEMSRIDLSRFLLALEYHLMQRNGLLYFYHNYLKQAVDHRYLAGEQEEIYQEGHLRIAEYFEGQPTSARKATELPWQLLQARKFDRLKECLSSIPMFLEFSADEKHFELLGYWLKIGSLDSMEESYRQHLAAFEQDIEDQLRIATVCDKLGNFLRRAGRYDAAEAMLRKAVEIHEKESGASHAETARALIDLAILLHTKGNFAEAQTHCERSLEIRVGMHGETHPDSLQTLHNLGIILKGHGKYEDAEKVYRKVLELRAQHLGEEHHETAKSINNLAHLLQITGKIDEAETLFRQVVEIRRKISGVDHPETADCMFNLGILHETKGELEYAEPLFRQTLEIRERSFGKKHPETGKILNSLGLLLRAQQQFDQAESLMRQVLEIWSVIFGQDHHYVAIGKHNLAELLRDMQLYDEAETLFNDAHRILDQTLGADHHLTAHPLNGLGKLYHKMEKLADAEAALLRALAIREARMGDHPETADTLQEYAELLRKMERHDEATVHAERARRIQGDVE